MVSVYVQNLFIYILQIMGAAATTHLQHCMEVKCSLAVTGSHHTKLTNKKSYNQWRPFYCVHSFQIQMPSTRSHNRLIVCCLTYSKVQLVFTTVHNLLSCLYIVLYYVVYPRGH